MAQTQIGEPWPLHTPQTMFNYGFGCFQPTPKPSPGLVTSTLFGRKVTFVEAGFDSEKYEAVYFDREGIITAIWVEFPDNYSSTSSVLKFAVLQSSGTINIVNSDGCRVID